MHNLKSKMDIHSKIQLSNFEVELLNNSEWILTKNGVMKKAQRLLEQVQQNACDYTTVNPGILPAEVMAISPKISKGENYLGLPWLILDYPRYFEKENIFAIRSMFWWGHFFTTTLHVTGEYKEQYRKSITRHYAALCASDFYISVHDEQWHHHLEPENYLPVQNFSEDDLADHISKSTFLKLAKKLSVYEWNNAVERLPQNFVMITNLPL